MSIQVTTALVSFLIYNIDELLSRLDIIKLHVNHNSIIDPCMTTLNHSPPNPKIRASLSTRSAVRAEAISHTSPHFTTGAINSFR